MVTAERRSLALCRDFADLLEYPHPELESQVDACIARLNAVDQTAAGLVRAFRQALKETSASRLEETYTGTFDMKSDGCLYVGHHLFGENWRRNLFLSLLKGHYQSRGHSNGNELPDYLPTMLRFVSEHEAEIETEELVVDCIVPALRKMAAADGAYAPLLKAILRFMTGEARL